MGMKDNVLRIDYDDDGDEVVDKVNEILAARGLIFVDDGLAHDGFCLFELKELKQES
jgi:hypothetical protein